MKLQEIVNRIRGNSKNLELLQEEYLKNFQLPKEREQGANYKNNSKLHRAAAYLRIQQQQQDHLKYFNEYREMVNTFPIIKAGLDIYAEEITAKNSDGNVIKIVSDNSRVKKALTDWFEKQIKINGNSFTIAKGMMQYGNQYMLHVFEEGKGIVDYLFLPFNEIEREELFNPDNLKDYRFRWLGLSGDYFKNYEISHFRNTDNSENLPYGTSVLQSIVETWRRVVLMREAMIIHRIVRAPSRFLFKVSTDGMTGEQAMRYVKDLKKENFKHPLVNPQTGEIDFKYNPISVEENFYLPVFDGSQSDVSVLEGSSNLDSVEDFKIIKDDIFAGLKIPKSFLTFEEDLSNKAALGEEDIRFAKTIQRSQADFIDELHHMAMVHLAYLGFSESDIKSFTLKMNNPSIVSEQRKLDLLKSRVDLATSLWNTSNDGFNLMSYTDICKTVLKLTDEEVKQSIKRQFIEAEIQWHLSQVKQNGNYYKNANTKGLNRFSKSGVSFDDLKFENYSNQLLGIEDLVKKKIDEEINNLFPAVMSTRATQDKAEKLLYEIRSGENKELKINIINEIKRKKKNSKTI